MFLLSGGCMFLQVLIAFQPSLPWTISGHKLWGLLQSAESPTEHEPRACQRPEKEDLFEMSYI